MPTPESALHLTRAIHGAVISLEERAKDLSLEQVLRATLDEAEALTGSCIGFYHFVAADQENLHLQAWSTRTEAEFCKAEGKGMHYPLSKAGVWADCLRVGQPQIHNDYQSLPNRQGLPYGHATVVRELVVPVKRTGRVVAVLGVGNKATDYDAVDVEAVQLLADLAWHLAESKQMTSALQQEKERFTKIFQASYDAMYVSDMEKGCYLDVNAAFERITGFSREEITGRTSTDLNLWFVPEDRLDYYKELQEKGRVHNRLIRIRHKEGRAVWAECNSSPMVLDGKPCMVSMARDVTERIQSQAALQASEARFHDISKASGDWIWEVNAEARYTYASGNVFGILGYSAEEVLGKTPFDLMPPGEAQRVGIIFAGIAARKEPFRDLPNMNLHRDGSIRHILTNGMPILGPEGNLQGYRGVDRDVTEQKHQELQRNDLEAQLQHAKKMESLGVFAGGVAHDMNNVLGAILGLASANLEMQAPGSRAYASFETIVRAATRGGEMVRSLLAFARQGQVEERLLDVNAILREGTQLLERTRLAKVHLELDLEPRLHPMRGDASALNHAFMNLCINAVDAMPGQGTLTLRTRNVDTDWLEVVVEDTGTGMPKEVLDRAMEPFFTTKGVGKGTGLGLSMVYSTVKAHQGQVEIQSRPGLGTQVRLRFPACEPTPEPAEQVDGAQAGKPLRPLKVLLVDDDELIQSSLGTVLQTLGHVVTARSSGEEALATLEAGFHPQVVILDMNMPGLGGSGTLPRLRAMLPTVPVLLSTGRTDQAALDLSQAHPFVSLLPKPFSLKDIQRCLETLESE